MPSALIAEIWDVLLHLIPILVGIIVAVVQIGRMFDSKLGEATRDIRKEIFSVKTDLGRAIDALWKDQGEQNRLIGDIQREHWKLIGAREAERKMKEAPE